MEQNFSRFLQMGITPETGDGFRPWIAAIILIVSVIVLITLIIFSKRSDNATESFQDEDEISEQNEIED